MDLILVDRLVTFAGGAPDRDQEIIDDKYKRTIHNSHFTILTIEKSLGGYIFLL